MQACLDAFHDKRYRILTNAVIGHGQTGVVYEFCTETDCDNYVAKVVMFDKGGVYNQTKTQFENEVRMTRLMAERGVSPPFLDSILCSELNLGIIIIGRMQITLHTWLRQDSSRYTEELKMLIIYKIYDLAVKGFYNRDLHSENIMLNTNPEDMKFIDAGYVREIGPHENVGALALSMWKSLQTSITNVTLKAGVKQARPLTPTQLDDPFTPTVLDTPTPPPKRRKEAPVL